MNALLIQLDGKLPNVALMRIAAHHADRGDTVSFRQAGNATALEALCLDTDGSRNLNQTVYASLIFERTRPLAEKLLQLRPDAIVGGTGWRVDSSLEGIGVTTLRQDYSIYPNFSASIGFTQRGCRLKCSFCVVPRKEGAVRDELEIDQLWRGDPHPRHLLLLDNDFFGQPRWREKCEQLRSGAFRVSFSQGINARLLNDESAEALASLEYYDDSFTTRRLYTAWDNRKDEDRLFAGLRLLKKHGVKPDQILVYMLIGYWPGETVEDRLYRQAKLRDFGCRPYPMPFTRSKELVGFQRWAIGAYDKRVPWADWVRASYRPERLGAT